jgi:hypothetical protein
MAIQGCRGGVGSGGRPEGALCEAPTEGRGGIPVLPPCAKGIEAAAVAITINATIRRSVSLGKGMEHL